MIVAVANPVSGHGRGRARVHAVERICAELGLELEVVQTAAPGDVVRATKEAAALRPDALILVGGDGSVGELCRAYADLTERPPVLLVPAGRGNSFYRAILSDAPWEEYLRRALTHSYVRGIDAARIAETGDVWALGCSLGYFHDTVAATRYFRGLRGRALYAAAGVYATMRLRAFGCEVWVDGRAVYAGRSVLVALAGGPFRGGRLLFFPAADLSDGLLDVVIVEELASRRFTEVLRAASMGRHVEEPDVHAFQGSEVRIASREMRCEVDGTVYPYGGAELTVSCLPALVPVAFPRGDWEPSTDPSGSGSVPV